MTGHFEWEQEIEADQGKARTQCSSSKTLLAGGQEHQKRVLVPCSLMAFILPEKYMWRCDWKSKEKHRHLGGTNGLTRLSPTACLTPISLLSPLKGPQTSSSRVPIYCISSCYTGTTLSFLLSHLWIINKLLYKTHPVVCNFIRWIQSQEPEGHSLSGSFLGPWVPSTLTPKQEWRKAPLLSRTPPSKLPVSLCAVWFTLTSQDFSQHRLSSFTL